MKRFHRMLALLLLLAYTGSGTSVMPAVFAALAAIDGSHRVMICRTEEGTQVRLHHREDDFTPEVCDHEGLLARLVVSFSRPATEGDHSLSSSQVTGSLTGPDAEAERLIKDKQCCSLPDMGFSSRFSRTPRQQDCKVARRDFHDSSGDMLRRIGTIRLLI